MHTGVIWPRGVNIGNRTRIEKCRGVRLETGLYEKEISNCNEFYT